MIQTLGTLQIGKTNFTLLCPLVDRSPEQATQPSVTYQSDGTEVPLSLDEVRAFKALFSKAERHLQLLAEIELRNRNLVLDLGS